MRTELLFLEQKLRWCQVSAAVPSPTLSHPVTTPTQPGSSPGPSTGRPWTSHHFSHLSSARRPLSCICYLVCTL